MAYLSGGVAAAAAVGVLSASSLAGVNLVTNGGFETGDFSGWTVEFAAMSSNIQVITQPNTGVFAALFGADGDENDAIFQSLVLVPGETYSLVYWIQNLGVGEDELRVFVEGAFDLTESPVSSELENWVMREVQFQATLTDTELRFEGRDTISSFLIDDVSVTLVPTAGSTALLALAGAFMLGSRRR